MESLSSSSSQDCYVMFLAKRFTFEAPLSIQGHVVQRAHTCKAIYQINCYSVDVAKTNCVIHMIVIAIYPLDSNIHPLNNEGQFCFPLGPDVSQHEVKGNIRTGQDKTN